MIDQSTANKAREMLGELEEKVKLITFTQEIECTYCRQNNDLARDFSDLSDKIIHEVYDFQKDREMVDRYHIDKIPALAVVSETKDYGIRFYGIPSGYEFTSLVEAVRLISTGDHGLSSETVDRVSSLKKDVHIQVFVTPTCPYCPRAVVTAHKLALVSEHIRSDMVEAIEFPHLTQKFNVMGVPRSVFNDRDYIEGAVPEKLFVDKIVEIGR
ncbi:MAG: glutaredoxin [Spirochaetes bacterium DG_61]|nr:MAG: glutaredoxin [Spirochaetes bacterium DG_61]